MERKLTKVVDGTEITVGGKMCSCGTDVANDLCSWESTDTLRGSVSYCPNFIMKPSGLWFLVTKTELSVKMQTFQMMMKYMHRSHFKNNFFVEFW